jgi:hypothetical protein
MNDDRMTGFSAVTFSLPKKSKITNQRQAVLSEFLEIINSERMNTKYKSLSGRVLAIKVSHIPTQDLYYLLSVCKDYMNRKGSFSRCFFGSLKVERKNFDIEKDMI